MIMIKGIGILVWLLCLLWNHAPALAEQTAKLPVAASIIPLADFCRQIGGDRVQVQVLIPPGASPHTFEPSPGLLSGLRQAKVVVINGAGLEPWVDRFLKTLKAKKPVVVTATAGLDLIREVDDHVREGGHHASEKKKPAADHDHHHAHGDVNPHVWLDPVLAQDICRRIAAAFTSADPEGRAVYEQQLQQYLEKLTALHDKIAATTGQFQIKEFIDFHPSFTYFARRYGLREVGTIEVAPGREPTPRALQNILAAVKRYGIRVIFSEPQFNPRIAEVLAQEAGVRVLSLDPIGGRPPYGESYLQLMEFNLATMTQAMK
ncbi:MAG: metal ABC transporter substrate-binding protein [Desulfobacca sp.]|uniref:metal ABC transporter substrate-binding protein n=1 Tax=Desulfobacca sp. TaxID=2067990 RepID=UPI004049C3E9